jgi:hypothetical protein
VRRVPDASSGTQHSEICRTKKTSRSATPRCSIITAWSAGATIAVRSRERQRGVVASLMKEAVDQALMLRGHRGISLTCQIRRCMRCNAASK